MTANAIHSIVADDFDAVNELILGQLHSDVDLVETISQYLVDSGGKRVRPMLVLLTAKCCGYSGDQHTLLATIIEFLHTATLLHDDVVDMSDLRRGRSTANAVWGNAPSVLVGDFLYSRAFQMMIRLNDMRILSILANCTNEISEGEVRQLTHVHNAELSEAQYMDVIRAKTAVLFQASSHTAAVLAAVDDTQERALEQFGLHLGMTFQLIDDLLDYDGDAEEMGKNVGDDLAEGKVTLPLIYAMQHATTTQLEMIRKAIREGSQDDFNAIIQLVRACGALNYTRNKARKEADKALALLQQLPDNPYRKAMADLVELAVNRSS